MIKASRIYECPWAPAPTDYFKTVFYSKLTTKYTWPWAGWILVGYLIVLAALKESVFMQRSRQQVHLSGVEVVISDHLRSVHRIVQEAVQEPELATHLASP